MTLRMAVWGPFALALAGVGLLWGAPARRAPERTVEPTPSELAAAAAESPRTLLVDFRDDVSDEALARNDVTEEPVSRLSQRDRLYRVRFATPDEARRAADRLRADATVESVDFDVSVSLSPGEILRTIPSAPGCDGKAKQGGDAEPARPQFPDDPCYRHQWHLAQVGLPSAWKAGQGTGAIVAVIDTGVSRVPDLADTEIVPGYNFVADNADASDDHGHGTHVAGTIAQSTNNRLGVAGVAFGAKIMPLKVLSAQGSGSMAAIAQAIRFAADHGANVINMSLGGPFPVNTIRSAIKYARDKGVVVIAAAGNDGRGRVSYPAKYPGAVAVAATQFDEATTFYSNWGPEIDVAAPGGNVRVDQNGDGLPDGVLQNTVVPGDVGRTDYLFFMGTSMASPHVAGVAALLVGAGVDQPDAVERLLLETARAPKTGPSRDGARVDDHYGAGLVDASSALAKARNARAVGAPLLGSTLAAGFALALRRRRRLAGGMLGVPFVVSLLLGGASAFFAASPIVASVAVPFAALALLWSVRRARPWLAGLAFGFAGALLVGAVAHLTNVQLLPDAIERVWLVAHAAIAAALGALTLRSRV